MKGHVTGTTEDGAQFKSSPIEGESEQEIKKKFMERVQSSDVRSTDEFNIEEVKEVGL